MACCCSITYLFLGASLCSRSHMTQPGNTTHPVCSLFPFLHQNMKLHAYNKSSFSHTQALCRIVSRQRKRNLYSTCKKANILCVIQKMVEEESLTYTEASSALGLVQSMISRWRKKEDVLAAIPKPNAFSLHLGPTSILKDITQRSPLLYWHLAQQGPSC